MCIGNGCKGYSTKIYILSKTDLTVEIDTSSGHDFFASFNVVYQNITQYGIWNQLTLKTLAPEQKGIFSFKLAEFSPVTIIHLGKKV